MLSVETSPLQQLENSLNGLNSNLSLGERITQMEVFIYTASLTLEGRDDSADLIASMSKVAIPTYKALVEHQKRGMTTRSRMMTSSTSHWTVPGRAEEAILGLVTNGLQSRVRKIVNHFGLWSTNWIQRVRLVLSLSSRNIVTGSSHHYLPVMNTPMASPLLEENLMGEIDGYHNLVWELENHS